MEENRKKEFWVGLFVLAGLAIIGLMIVEFGQLEHFYRPVYQVQLTYDNVGGLVHHGNVQFAGVKVGRVTEIKLNTNSDRKVHVTIEIDRAVQIRKDAKFAIRTSGMLGDQHIDIEPVAESQAPILQGGEQLAGQAPVDFGAVADRLKGAVEKIEKRVLDPATLDALHDAIHEAKDTLHNAKAITAKVNEQVLNDEAVVHFRQTLANLKEASEKAKSAAAEVEKFAREKQQPLDDTIQKVRELAENAKGAVAHVDKILKDNEQPLRDTLANAKELSEKLNKTIAGLQAGEGSLGALLTDKALHEQAKALIENLNKVVENMRYHGLLYKEPKSTPSNEAPKSSGSSRGLKLKP